MVRAPFGYDGYKVHELLMRKFGDQESSLGFMAIVNQHVVLSNDKTKGLQNVETTLDQISSTRYKSVRRLDCEEGRVCHWSHRSELCCIVCRHVSDSTKRFENGCEIN